MQFAHDLNRSVIEFLNKHNIYFISIVCSKLFLERNVIYCYFLIKNNAIISYSRQRM